MGKPKEFKMPKGKILMGKKTPAPIEKAVPRNEEKRGGPRYEKQPVPDGKRQPKPNDKKRPLPMPRPIPGRKRPVPMPGDRTLPKRGGGAVPKGGMVNPGRTLEEQRFIEKQKQLPSRPTKPRTLEEKKFIMDELRRSPRRPISPRKGLVKEKQATVAPRRGARYSCDQSQLTQSQSSHQ